MNKPTVFTGAATAIITPLTPDGIDFDRYGAMIDWQIEAGIDAIVAVGTTGEGSTLSDEEHRAAIKYCVERVNHRVPVIAGTGSNDTAYSVELSRYAASVGADAMLLVTPYYNKATQKGMIALDIDLASFDPKSKDVSTITVTDYAQISTPFEWLVSKLLHDIYNPDIPFTQRPHCTIEKESR